MTPAPSSASTSDPASKLALGTVQFGQPYGVSNTLGQPAETDVARILETARAHDIDLLDTAPAYGDAESVLGRVLGRSHDFKVVTKTTPLRAHGAGTDAGSIVTAAFEQSLNRLGIGRVHGLIVHLAEDLLGADADAVWRALEDIKAGGGAAAIGVSCYTGEELRPILDRYPIDLVQAPFNIFDQALLRDGLLDRMNATGVEMHARSIFLQGLAMMSPDDLPDGFTRAAAPLRAFHDAAQAAGLSPLELALRYVAAVPSIDRLVVGVAGADQLLEIVDALGGGLPDTLDTDALAVTDRAVVTPSSWPPDEAGDWGFDFSAPERSDTP